ncbi:MAG: prepilin-type N-terminal cleavage/methylation domain-containing protein [Rickettsiales bacterium]|nr:prepilin-type N-terminal cleavage/methylation domain-containing protein [Rickettsiales bacterium]
MKKAYSLLELSIVVIIIGVLISGVAAGFGMIRASKISNTRLFTSKSPVIETSGLVAWYETSLKESLDGNQATDGAQITNWYDLNPGSNSGVAGATKKNKLESVSPGATFISDGINGTPSISFASNARFTLSAFYQGTSSQNTIFLVLRPLSTLSATAQVVLDSISTAYTTSIGLENAAINLNTGTGVDSAATTLSSGTDYVISAYFNNASSQAFVNSASTALAAENTGTNQLTGLTIGTNKGGTAGFTGLISEVIIFNRVLKSQERKDIMNYLSKKYKISVAGL